MDALERLQDDFDREEAATWAQLREENEYLMKLLHRQTYGGFEFLARVVAK